MDRGGRKRWRRQRHGSRQVGSAPAEFFLLERKRHSDGDRVWLGVKKRRIERLISLGQSCSLNPRHRKQLTSLSSLITSPKKGMRFTDDHDEVLYDNATNGLYMEWCDKRESNFLWMSNHPENTTIRLEMLAVFGDCSMDLEDRNPKLLFSEGFDGDAKWQEVKILLQEIFGPPNNSPDHVPNYIYAFTRISEKFHFRIFKVHNWPNSKDLGMKLEQTEPYFVFKPVSYKSNPFINAEMLCMKQTTNLLDLKSSAVLSDISHSSSIRHFFVQPDERTVFLPSPWDTLQWEGFNTTAAEFFERYHPFKRTRVPGTGSPPPPFDMYIPSVPLMEQLHLCLPFQFFGRSLILLCEAAFEQNACYARIKLSNMFFRGKELKILGVELVGFSKSKAIENLKQAGKTITLFLTKLGVNDEDFPVDLKDVLRLLGESPLLKLHLIKNHSCWMDKLDRISMSDNSYDDFLNHMNTAEKLEVGKAFPNYRRLSRRIAKNWLITELCNYHVRRTRSGRQAHLRKMRDRQKPSVGFNESLANRLFCIRQFFKIPRNAFQHLVSTAANFKIQLTREEVEFIVYSIFADVYTRGQVGLTRAFTNRKRRTPLNIERSSFARFGRYFRGAESIQFNDNDRK